jgi:hypothetical protein
VFIRNNCSIVVSRGYKYYSTSIVQYSIVHHSIDASLRVRVDRVHSIEHRQVLFGVTLSPSLEME